MSTAPKPQPELLVYKELGPGDMRKLLAQSNDSTTGGGARDLRFPWRSFRPIMHRIFADEVIKSGKNIRTARITFKTINGNTAQTKMEYWPATKSRPSEDRLAKIPAIAKDRLPDEGRGRVFFMLIRWSTGEVRTYYAYENDLRSQSGNGWAPNVRDALLTCMRDTDNINAGRSGSLLSVQGYYDFLDGTVHCHADR